MIWLSLTLPTLGFLVWAFPIARQPAIWGTVFSLALATVVGWIGLDVWFAVSDGASYSLNRVAFMLIQMVDFPLLAITVGSFCNWGLVRWGLSAPARSSAPATETELDAVV